MEWKALTKPFGPPEAAPLPSARCRDPLWSNRCHWNGALKSRHDRRLRSFHYIHAVTIADLPYLVVLVSFAGTLDSCNTKHTGLRKVQYSATDVAISSLGGKQFTPAHDIKKLGVSDATD
jgi:hypothetical protein